MKIFRAVTERDGKTTKAPGSTQTEVIRTDYRYAAETIEQVWDVINNRIIPEEETIIAVIEEHPAITVLEAE